MVGLALWLRIDLEMSAQYTYQQIANNFFLWQEYANTDLALTESEFNQLSESQKIKLQILAFGPETESSPSTVSR